jgi:hypothetical protein
MLASPGDTRYTNAHATDNEGIIASRRFVKLLRTRPEPRTADAELPHEGPPLAYTCSGSSAPVNVGQTKWLPSVSFGKVTDRVERGENTRHPGTHSGATRLAAWRVAGALRAHIGLLAWSNRAESPALATIAGISLKLAPESNKASALRSGRRSTATCDGYCGRRRECRNRQATTPVLLQRRHAGGGSGWTRCFVDNVKRARLVHQRPDVCRRREDRGRPRPREARTSRGACLPARGTAREAAAKLPSVSRACRSSQGSGSGGTRASSP